MHTHFVGERGPSRKISTLTCTVSGEFLLYIVPTDDDTLCTFLPFEVSSDVCFGLMTKSFPRIAVLCAAGALC